MSQGTYTVGGKAGKARTRCGVRVTDKYRTREEKLAQRTERAAKARAFKDRCKSKA